MILGSLRIQVPSSRVINPVGYSMTTLTAVNRNHMFMIIRWHSSLCLHYLRVKHLLLVYHFKSRPMSYPRVCGDENGTSVKSHVESDPLTNANLNLGFECYLLGSHFPIEGVKERRWAIIRCFTWWGRRGVDYRNCNPGVISGSLARILDLALVGRSSNYYTEGQR